MAPIAALILAAALVPLQPPPPEASGASGSIDPEAATRAYIARLSPEQKARSEAYFEGGYWLGLWSFLWSAGVFLLLLKTGFSARMRDRAERLTRFKAMQVTAYWVQFALVMAVLTFPLTVYASYFREHKYGLSNLTFAAWLGEEGKGLLVSLVTGSLAMIALYAVVRRMGRTWWIWGAVVAIVLLSFGLLIGPVLITPIFNSPKRLEDQRVVAPILRLARANGIKAGEVWEIDASKQSKRMSANVSGFLGTERITLNDNLLNRAALEEIEAVMGHEMGHYVLNHIYAHLITFGLIIAVGFALLSTLYERLRGRWGLRGIDDLAGLPLAALLFTSYLFVMTPVINSVIRSAEYEADIFGLNASAQPDGFAQAALDLSEYRKMEPGRLEELLLYDHPSGRTRIFAAMRWKAEHPETWGKARPPRTN
jgi:STE24 endopeptidase